VCWQQQERVAHGVSGSLLRPCIQRVTNYILLLQVPRKVAGHFPATVQVLAVLAYCAQQPLHLTEIANKTLCCRVNMSVKQLHQTLGVQHLVPGVTGDLR
jgi:hypothetical protein